MTGDLQAKMASIAHSISVGAYRYTIHGAQQRIARGIRRLEIEDVIAGGEIIEDYPQHHYGPACLILGRTSGGKALHIVCSTRAVVDIITMYEPDPNEWEPDLRTRKAQT